LDLMIHKAKITVVPFTAEHTEEARNAWRIYGKGNHPAGLNFCDCCAYALSGISANKLLFKGNDFTQTDVAPVIQQSRARSPAAMKIDLGKTYYRQGFFNDLVSLFRPLQNRARPDTEFSAYFHRY